MPGARSAGRILLSTWLLSGGVGVAKALGGRRSLAVEQEKGPAAWFTLESVSLKLGPCKGESGGSRPR